MMVEAVTTSPTNSRSNGADTLYMHLDCVAAVRLPLRRRDLTKVRLRG
jgi:hypothetical protein